MQLSKNVQIINSGKFISNLQYYAMLPNVYFSFLWWVKFFGGCYGQVFYHLGDKKKMVAGRVRQVVVLYSSNCIGICLGGLSIGRLRRVVVL